MRMREFSLFWKLAAKDALFFVASSAASANAPNKARVASTLKQLEATLDSMSEATLEKESLYDKSDAMDAGKCNCDRDGECGFSGKKRCAGLETEWDALLTCPTPDLNGKCVGTEDYAKGDASFGRDESATPICWRHALGHSEMKREANLKLDDWAKKRADGTPNVQWQGRAGFCVPKSA